MATTRNPDSSFGKGFNRLAMSLDTATTVQLSTQPYPAYQPDGLLRCACIVTHPEKTVERETFTIIRCSNADTRLFPHFLRIIAPMITTLGPEPTQAIVRPAIARLVSLFQALTAPTSRSIQGLWAKL